MAKYSFDRLDSGTFETLAQSLLEKTYRTGGRLTQFKATADGGREATWTQPVTHENYRRPEISSEDIPREWVFQVKFHSIGERGWRGAGDALLSDLRSELEKIHNKYKVPCHSYVLMTNVPLTGDRHVGYKDRIGTISKKWSDRIPHVEVWDAADISRMLDANRDVATAYAELITPGDILAKLLHSVAASDDKISRAMRAYLRQVVKSEKSARAEQAGDDKELPLSAAFVDLSLELDQQTLPESCKELVQTWRVANLRTNSRWVPVDLDDAPASFVMLLGEHRATMIMAGPGRGKSTLSQYLALFHAARVVDSELATRLVKRLKLPSGSSYADVDSRCKVRVPFRIELRRYAQWRSEDADGSLAKYIVERLINKESGGTLSLDDMYRVLERNPSLLILDGLDEVPDREARENIVKDTETFLLRCESIGDPGGLDVQLVLSSRPQGYGDEFARFEPIRWKINDLSESDFSEYCLAWLSERMSTEADRAEARDRIARGMESSTVREMATTLLQATVMLTIVRKKIEIPAGRQKLFSTYVSVVFDREKSKSKLVARYENELRQLHCLTAYELHRAQGSNARAKIGALEFRRLALGVWESFDPNGSAGSPGLKSIIDEIVRATKDRLVFLSGTGKEQDDIGFMIQSFREYFAAQFLHGHEDADSNKVFEQLAIRGPYWENVLQFYFASRDVAQQMLWVHRAAEVSDLVGGSLDELLASVSFRRALLRSLPEFLGRPTRSIDSAVSAALAADTRWVWTEEDMVALRNLRAPSVVTSAVRTILSWGVVSDADKFNVVRLLSALLDSVAELPPEISSYVSTLLVDDEFVGPTLEVIIRYNVQVDIRSVDPIRVVRAMQVSGLVGAADAFDSFYERLSKEQRAAAACGGVPVRRGSRVQFEFWTEVGLPADHFARLGEGGGKFGILSRGPYVGELTRFGSDDDVGVFQRYLRALVRAMENSVDPSLDAAARSAYSMIDSWGYLSPDDVLGPAPSTYRTESEWIAFRRELLERQSDAEAWVESWQQLSVVLGAFRRDGRGVASLAILFHPDDWSILVRRGLLRESERATLDELGLVGLLRKCSGPLSHRALHVPGRIRMDSVEGAALLDSLVEICQGRPGGADRIVLCDISFSSPLPADVVRRFLEGTRGRLSVSQWSSLLVEVVCSAERVDGDLLRGYWVEVVHAGRHGRVASEWCPERSDVVREVLRWGTWEGVGLARAIWNAKMCRPELAVEIATVVCDLGRRFIKSDDVGGVWMLTQLPVSLSEIALWEDAEFLASCGQHPFVAEFFAQRISEALLKGHWDESVAHVLERVVGSRDRYPRGVVMGAVEGLVRIRARATPMSDSAWQRLSG